MNGDQILSRRFPKPRKRGNVLRTPDYPLNVTLGPSTPGPFTPLNSPQLQLQTYFFSNQLLPRITIQSSPYLHASVLT